MMTTKLQAGSQSFRVFLSEKQKQKKRSGDTHGFKNWISIIQPEQNGITIARGEDRAT